MAKSSLTGPKPNVGQIGRMTQRITYATLALGSALILTLTLAGSALACEAEKLSDPANMLDILKAAKVQQAEGQGIASPDDEHYDVATATDPATTGSIAPQRESARQAALPVKKKLVAATRVKLPATAKKPAKQKPVAQAKPAPKSKPPAPAKKPVTTITSLY
jgi:hypothetical protein